MKPHGYEVISDFSENPTILPASSVDWKAVAAGTANDQLAPEAERRTIRWAR